MRLRQHVGWTPDAQPANLAQLWQWNLVGTVSAEYLDMDDEKRDAGVHQRLNRVYLDLFSRVSVGRE